MQAIKVKYLAPTNNRPSRWKAECAAGSVTVSYDCEGESQCVERAVKALCKKLGWNGNLVSGQLPTGEYCFVFLPHHGFDFQYSGDPSNILTIEGNESK